MEVEQEGRWTLVKVAGELDLATAPELRSKVLNLVDDGARNLALELSAVGFMDSSGLGAIMACAKRVQELGGDLVIVAPEGSSVTKLFALTGLEDAIERVGASSELPPG
ncbi:MAG: STAS domain-containing protein [Actinomycetota bacterium]